MKTINNIIENSALSLLNKALRCSSAILFLGIVTTGISLFVAVLGNIDHVNACFNF